MDFEHMRWKFAAISGEIQYSMPQHSCLLSAISITSKLSDEISTQALALWEDRADLYR